MSLRFSINTPVEQLRKNLREHLKEFCHYLEVQGKVGTTVAQYVSLINAMYAKADIRDEFQFRELLNTYSSTSRGARNGARTLYMNFLTGTAKPKPAAYERAIKNDAMRVSQHVRKHVREYLEKFDEGVYDEDVVTYVQRLVVEWEDAAKANVIPLAKKPAVSNKVLTEVAPVMSELDALLAQLTAIHKDEKHVPDNEPDIDLE
jgi:hypothetical protein